MYEVPQFLKTCKNTTKEEAKNLGVVIKSSTKEMINEVVEAAVRYHTEVPVLIITRGAEKDELQRVVKVLDEYLSDLKRGGSRHTSHRRMSKKEFGTDSRSTTPDATPRGDSLSPDQSCRSSLASPPKADPISRRGSGRRDVQLESPGRSQRRLSDAARFPSGKAMRRRSTLEEMKKKLNQRIQVLQERNEKGESIIATANAVIEQATRRCYSETREAYFQITVTDWFGGRGHDFDCLDEGANHSGGMLVIATTVPDAREWAQWKGRTARQVGLTARDVHAKHTFRT